MTTAHATPLLEPVTADDAREELAKFFQLAESSPGMFSTFIDKEWHRLAETADYDDFCRDAVGRVVAHLPICGEGEVAWLNDYHELWGALPPVWFADETGVVDSSSYGRYLDTRTVHASWNCSPDTDPGVTSCPNGN
jgi:hypothetical protein